MMAALNRLLPVETREYGQSGLYHALYCLDLSVEGINIVDGEARIALSGTLTNSGSTRVQRFSNLTNAGRQHANALRNVQAVFSSIITCEMVLDFHSPRNG